MTVHFPTDTAWSLILGARNRSPQQFEQLVNLYWQPVCGCLQRRWNLSSDDAADLTQEFFVRLFEDDSLKDASPERGRFRTFIKLKLRDLVVDDLRKRAAQKRGGAARFVAIDAAKAEPIDPGLAPDEAFDRAWASAVLARSIRDLETALVEEGKETSYRAFFECVLSKPSKSYKECAASLGIKESDVRNWVFRARAQLKEIVLAHVRASVEHESDADAELSSLLKLLE